MIKNRSATVNNTPLKTTTRATAEKLVDALGQSGRDPGGRCLVDWAMRYGKPAIADPQARERDEMNSARDDDTVA